MKRARTDGSLVVQLEFGEVIIEVYDKSQDLPRMQPPDPIRNMGRGLQIIGALARHWGTTRTTTDKKVWARVAVSRGPEAVLVTDID